MTSLRTKLWLGLGGLLLIVVAVSSLTLVVLTRYSRALERVFHENYDSAVFCDRMRSSLDRLNDSAQRLVWAPSVPVSPKDIAAQQAQFRQNLDRQLHNVTLPGELELSRHLADLWQRYEQAYADFLSAAAADRPGIFSTDLLPDYQQLKATAQRVAEMNMNNMVSVDGQAKRTLVGVRNALLVLSLAGSLLAAALVGTVAVSLRRPLATLTASAREIESGKLDLDLGQHPPRRDEIGQLTEAFNAMVAKLREFRRMDHERLARTQQTTQLAIDSLPDAVMVISTDGAIEIANRSAQIHFGITPGRRLGELQVPWLADIVQRVLQQRSAHEPQGYKSALQRFDHGQERFLLPRAVPMFDHGRLIGVSVIVVDVTRLRQADEVKSGLLSMVSHELRTPLTSVRMALALVSGGKLGPLPPRQEKVLTAARDDAERLHRIIENLLSMSRIEAGNVQASFRPMTAEQIIALAVEPLREAFDAAQQQLTVTTPMDLPPVSADPASIGLVLTNLLSNANKFTPSGGQVRLSVSAEAGDLLFTVSDTGPGVPPEYAPRIFEKFFRAPPSSGPGTAPGGAGLGLSIAREVAEAHGGTLTLASGAGSTFLLRLPIAIHPAPSPAPSAAPAMAS